MFFVKFEKQKKYLCLILTIVLMLLAGMDISGAEVKANVLHVGHGKMEAAVYTPKGVWVNRDACTEDLLGIREINSRMEQSGSTEERAEDMIGALQGPLLGKSLLYSQTGIVPIHTGCLCCSVIIGYVHRQDGKKDSIII